MNPYLQLLKKRIDENFNAEKLIANEYILEALKVERYTLQKLLKDFKEIEREAESNLVKPVEEAEVRERVVEDMEPRLPF